MTKVGKSRCREASNYKSSKWEWKWEVTWNQHEGTRREPRFTELKAECVTERLSWEPVCSAPIVRDLSLSPRLAVVRWFSWEGKKQPQHTDKCFHPLFSWPLVTNPFLVYSCSEYTFFKKRKKSWKKRGEEALLLVPVITGNLQLSVYVLIFGISHMNLDCPAFALSVSVWASLEI